ncbi:MAG: S-methyl-5-thioribose-1-phosphate isomerase [Myxococcales bacterium]|nr:S-methyl-5-thioribose-1-phosphate isomerase [Polyangiaceae bacterium]MDW8249299.1 S-methyl-5-thioribose-1-phosphate isomerase [Myxococcales bacterium]
MNVQGKPTRTIWTEEGDDGTWIIDQTCLPYHFVVRRLTSAEEAAYAIRTMQVRGAPLIGATAAHGIALEMRRDPSDPSLDWACSLLMGARPTAVNLRWAVERMRFALKPLSPGMRPEAARRLAATICDEDVALNRSLAEHGLPLLLQAWHRKGKVSPVQVLTHCNAGWLATVDGGTALAPVYAAHDAGIPVHVWVDETRPRNQGASLTAWELGQHGVPHTLITDNAGGYLMQRGRVDLCLVGTDRTTACGDVANKIGTYLKALAARDNEIPFYVALPSPSLDTSLRDGLNIPIEERDPSEVTHLTGQLPSGEVASVLLAPAGTRAANPGFDVTPARLITALITERGVCPASEEGLRALFPERYPETP